MHRLGSIGTRLEHWLAHCSDSTGNGEVTDASEHQQQYKVGRKQNLTRCAGRCQM